VTPERFEALLKAKPGETVERLMAKLSKKQLVEYALDSRDRVNIQKRTFEWYRETIAKSDELVVKLRADVVALLELAIVHAEALTDLSFASSEDWREGVSNTRKLTAEFRAAVKKVVTREMLERARHPGSSSPWLWSSLLLGGLALLGVYAGFFVPKTAAEKTPEAKP